MSRIKMNLDMLEEVRMQNEIAMNATEDVINQGRADLNSLTEEVWEGEDGDMARELLGDLVYKEMPDTWKHIDSCHQAMKKAQKSSYESKNFCNGFPQIFRDGTMPSDTDSSICSGDLMCDKGSCTQLIASMEAAAQFASSAKSNVERAESILAELETDEAKFDYSSYTVPIKTQTQNVIDRVGIFNKAVTKYEQKVEELDQTFSKELIAAVPVTALTPFDPSCLLGGDTIHMEDGDIINFLEAHSSIDIGGRLSDAQLENILAMLFDKKDVDVAGLSREDFEVAFLNLPEEKQKAILMEIGLTRRQIDSILESKESKRSFIDQLCDSKTKDRFNNILKNSPYAPKTTSKDGGNSTTTTSSGSTGQSGYNNGITQCNSDSVKPAFSRLPESEYDELAAELNEAAAALCDDDPSNDAAAMEIINQDLARGFYFEYDTNENGDEILYLKYEEHFIEYCKEQAGEGSLLWGLLTDFGDYINENGNGKVSPFDGNAWFPSYSLEISQLGAGYQLVLNVDSEWGFGAEKDNVRVAYAATEETCKNYFYSGGEYNWDAIKKWCTTSDPVTDEAEYVFLSEMLMNMDLDNLNTFLSKAQLEYKELYTCYNFRGQMQILACFYEKAAKERADGAEDNKDGYKSDYARALCFSEVISTIAVREKHHEFFKLITFNDQGQGEYTAHFTNLKSGKEDYITAYPYCSEETMLLNIAENMKNIYKPSVLDSFYSVLDTWIQAGLFSPLAACEVAIIDEINSYVDSVIKFGDMEDQIKLQKAVSMYDVNGYLVTGNIDDEQYADIIAESFDECTINAATIYYNSVYGSNITTQDLKDSFSATSGEGKTIRDNYSQIFMGEGETNIEDIGSTLCTIASYDKESSFDSDNITDDQIYEAAEYYRFMEEKFDMFCSENQITDAENIIELTDAQLLELYYYTFG